MSYAPQYGIRRKWVKRAKNPFSLPCAVAPLNGRRAKHFLSTERRVVHRAGNGKVRYSRKVPELQVLGPDIDPRRVKAALMPGVNVWHYSKAVSKAMAKNTVRYRAPYGVRPHMYLWHKTKWFGRFDENPWHPKPMHSPTGEFLGYANPDAPVMHIPYKVARALTGSGQ